MECHCYSANGVSLTALTHEQGRCREEYTRTAPAQKLGLRETNNKRIEEKCIQRRFVACTLHLVMVTKFRTVEACL